MVQGLIRNAKDLSALPEEVQAAFRRPPSPQDDFY